MGKPGAATTRNRNATTLSQPTPTACHHPKTWIEQKQALRSFWVALDWARSRLKIRVSVVRFRPWQPLFYIPGSTAVPARTNSPGQCSRRLRLREYAQRAGIRETHRSVEGLRVSRRDRFPPTDHSQNCLAPDSHSRQTRWAQCIPGRRCQTIRARMGKFRECVSASKRADALAAEVGVAMRRAARTARRTRKCTGRRFTFGRTGRLLRRSREAFPGRRTTLVTAIRCPFF
jgi:hypothetical protein